MNTTIPSTPLALSPLDGDTLIDVWIAEDRHGNRVQFDAAPCTESDMMNSCLDLDSDGPIVLYVCTAQVIEASPCWHIPPGETK